MQDVCEVVDIGRDLDVLVESLGAESPAGWKVEPVVEMSEVFFAQSGGSVPIAGLHYEDLAVGRIEQVYLAARVEGGGEGVAAVDVAGAVTALTGGLRQRGCAHHPYPGAFDGPEFPVVSGFADMQLVEHPVTYRIEPGAQRFVLAREGLGFECVDLLRCRVARTGRVPDVRDCIVLACAGNQAYLAEPVAAHVLHVDLPARYHVLVTGSCDALLKAGFGHGSPPIAYCLSAAFVPR